ncbi:MAG: DUF1858 domain-containing protein [FCB group bacterium]|nr:DUF1858 domain-containing protein [FCB group bacterium]
MSTYMKRFVFASLFYLGLGTIFGILNGTIGLGYFGIFAHTHFNLLGFMAMVIFGIGYFILPRFNGTELRFNSWVAVHFWLANISLIGMIIFRGLAVDSGEATYNILFIIFASVQVISIFMFIINIWLTLTPQKQPVAQTPTARRPLNTPTISQRTPPPKSFVVEPSGPNFPVTPDTKVSELIDALPSLKELLISSGVRALQLPGHLEKVRAMGITIGMVANNHGINLDKLILKIEKEFQQNGFTTKINLNDDKNDIPMQDLVITTETLIGEAIEKYPQSKTVFEKYFGAGCFDCPGQAFESIKMACQMHGVDADSFIKELHHTIR